MCVRGALIVIIILGVPIKLRATSGPLAGSQGTHPSLLGGEPGSGGVAHRTPVDLPTKRSRWRRSSVGPAGDAARGCGFSPIRARPISRLRFTGSVSFTISGSPSGTSTGTPATTCPATACCFRRWPRCSGCDWWRRCRSWPPPRCSSVSRSPSTDRRRAGARHGSPWPRSATSGSDALPSRWASPSRWRPCSRSFAGAPSRRACSRRCALRPAPSRACCSRLPASRTRCRSARRAALLALAAPAGGGRGPGAALSRGRLRALPDPLVRGDRPRRCGVSVGAPAAAAAAARRGARVSARLRCCAWCCTRRWAATSSATRCCWPVAAVRAAPAGRGRRSAGGRRVSRRRGTPGLTPAAAVALCAWARLGGMGTGARDARGGGERIDQRLLLRAGRALPGRARACAGARRGAAHALALGGGAARADGLARARLGEAAGHPLRRGAARAAGSPRRPIDRWLDEQAVSYVALPDTPLDPSSAQEGRLIRRGPALSARGVREQALADLRGARADAAGLRPRAADVAGPRLVRAARFLRGELPGARALHPLLDHRARCRLRGTGAGGLDVGPPRAPGVVVAARFSLARALGLEGSCTERPP